MMRLRRTIALLALPLVLCAAAAAGDDIASADLRIAGSSLAVVETAVETGIGIPTTIQTEFGGKRNDEAPFVPGLLAMGELSGPGLDPPITLETTPGHAFRIPGLPVKGEYTLQNIRLAKDGRFLQPATPSFATIVVADVLKTAVKVRQLTAQDLRDRGIALDGANYDYYEYTFSVTLASGETVEVPYVVAIDPTTHQARPVVGETPYALPPDRQKAPPRWSPPRVTAFEFVSETELPVFPQSPLDPLPTVARPSIPAAIVIPNDIAVLHQFFEVSLMVRNGASAGSSITLDSITATIQIPRELRVAETDPVVSFGQPVPILDADDMTILHAQAEGSAEWILEALRAGSFTIEFDLRATYRAPGQPDVPLRAAPKTSLLVHDPRFNITFSHPDVVRQGIEYSTFSFVTNMSPALQNIRVSSGITACVEGFTANICLVEGSPEFHELTLAPGETEIVEYQFRPAITGHAYASAGAVDDDVLTAEVLLHVGVDENGIPLSPATLLLPHYTRYPDPDLVDAQLELLGLGYSLATAPLNQTTAKFPRVIRSDVFERAADLARAGQRLFIGEAEDLALLGMNLSLLGNEVELREWDDLRRLVDSGRTAQAAIAGRLKQIAIGSATDYAGLLDRVAPANADRGPFLAAFAHAPAGAERPVAVTLRGATTGRLTGYAPAEDDQWTNDLPFADVTDLDPREGGAAGALALIGRWTENVELVVTPQASGAITIELVHPAAAAGRILRTTLSLTGTAGEPVAVAIAPGQTQVEARNAAGAILAVATPSEIIAPALAPVAARQDLHLDEDGHRVSVLFNRPIASEGDLKAAFGADVIYSGDGLEIRRSRPISGAAAQADGRIVNLNFDHILSKNAGYEITIGTLVDPLTETLVSLGATVQPTVDNDRPAGLLFGKVLRADNAPVYDAEVALSVYARGKPLPDSVQFDAANPNGEFFFEYVRRDPEQGFDGAWSLDAVDGNGKATSTSAAIRSPGVVQYVNLVYLGRGSAEGYVRYDDGTKAAGAAVVVGSTMFNESRRATADANGFYRVENLPVGPLTFSAKDSRGRIVYAANEVRTAGTVVVQDLVIPLGEAAGTGSVRGIVIRSDSQEPVAGARVGIYSRSHAVGETYTASDGRFEFESVPAGFVTLLAAEWSVSRKSAAQDFDLRPDSTRELTMTLEVVPAEALVRVDGYVQREDPLHPGDESFYQRVAGAVVQVEGLGVVAADADGNLVFENVPESLGGRTIKAWDPATGRAVSVELPRPLTSPTTMRLLIPAQGSGTGTIRVKLLDAAGFPRDGIDVFVPGYPDRTNLDPKLDGVYELPDVQVGSTETIWAVDPNSAQYVHGSARVAFDGHVAPLNLRLPGQGTVRVAVRSDIALITDVKISYMTWSDGEQRLTQTSTTRSTLDAGGAAGYAIFDGVPALAQFTVSSAHPVHGNASASGRLAFDGDLQTITLQLDRLASLDGVVYAIDGRTPIAAATVRLFDGRQDQGATLTAPDGSFSFRNLPAGAAVQAIASVTQDGIYRIGYANAKTPAGGGAVENVGVVLRRQSTVQARVVYAAYRVFDPNDPSKNVPDDTLEDLSDNAPVPYARLWLRELGFPSRWFGSASEARTADAAGHIDFGNVFEGSLRASAWDPGNQELRGVWTGQLEEEGDPVVALIGIGGAGVGSLEATVLDPDAANAPVLNAEVLLLRKGYQTWIPFDFASSDGAGKALFENLPAGDYSVQAYLKAEGRSGGTGTLAVTPNERTDASILLEFRGRVTGQVLDRYKADPTAGIEVAGSHVTLNAMNYSTRATTNGVGTFEFEGVREGTLKLTARDPESNRRASATREFSRADGDLLSGVDLELEPTETLEAEVYLPADDGSSSGVLAPAINVDVKQRCTTRNWIEFCDFYTSLQENPITVGRMMLDGRYYLAIRELGGEQRTVSYSSSFPKGSESDPIRLVLPAFGSVRVQVEQAGQPAAGARVTASGGGKQATAYTDATGSALLGGLRLGPVSIQVRSLAGDFSGSTSATIASQSTPAIASVVLGSYAALAGYVEAEAGGPSVGTIVAARFSGKSLDTLTNGEGRYQLHGIPTSATGVAVSLDYIGPDGVTVGASQSAVARNEHAGTIVELAPVRLDATPPRLISITPSDGAAEVPPDTFVQFVFTEPIPVAYETGTHLRLYSTGSASPVPATFDRGSQADGSYFITLKPSAKLESNTLYRVFVSKTVADASGHPLGTDRGSSFITTDYAEPRVLRTEPPADQPLQAATTFRFVFNEAMNPEPWAPGGAGSIRLFRISAPGGTIVAETSGSAFLDLASPDTLVFGPDEPIEGEAYYRATVAGASDLQGNVAAPQSFEWASFDATPPFVTLVSPLPAGEPLISGVEYTLVPDIRNGAPDGTPATDVEQVELFRLDGETATYLTKKTAPPFSYRFVAPDAPVEGTTIAFRVIARDRSLNSSEPATIVLPVRRNEPPQNVAVALDRTEAYPSNRITAGVTFEDEGFVATITITAAGIETGGSAWELVKTKQVSRAATADPWPESSFSFDLPATLAGGSTVTFTARVTDVRGLASTGSATAAILVDPINPEILALAPAAETRFAKDEPFRIEVQARDLESGVAEVAAKVGRADAIPLALVGEGTEPGVKLYRSAEIVLPVSSVDTRIPIVATVKDWQANAATRTVEVIAVGEYDPEAPKAAWACPVDRAAYPAGAAITIPLRVVATDPLGIDRVEFELPGASTVAAEQVGETDVWEKAVTVTMPASGESLELTAIVRDADAHEVRLTIQLDAIAIDRVVELAPQAITASNIGEWTGKSVLVRGSAAQLVAHVPLSFTNLVVLDGAKIVTKATTTGIERTLELEVAGTLYVDCSSSIDLTATGYPGGWGVDTDGSGIRNEDSRGRTAGNVTAGGAEAGTSASHGGLGGLGSGAITNEPYGSIVAPASLGSGGGGNASCCTAGAPGGGAMAIRGGSAAGDLSRIVLAGSYRADGGSGVGKAGAGSGGSILVDAKQVILGAQARVTANGGDDDARSNGSSGGGGGRISVRARERFDASAALAELVARGGNNGAADTATTRLDGGAGTIWLARPGATDGALVVSSFDSLHAAAAHQTRPTPLAGADLRFDAVTVGPRALLRVDEAIVVSGVADDLQQFSIDPTAVVLLRSDVPQVTLATTRAAGEAIPRGGSLSVQYTATSVAGIGAVSSIWSPVTPDRRDVTAAYPPSVAPAAYLLAVPSDATLGEATLMLRAEDRAGRIAETSFVSFTVVENTPVEFTRFDVNPATLALYPGGTASVTVDVRDDLQVKTLTFVATVAGAEVKRETRTVNAATAADVVFSYAIPPATPGGQDLVLTVLAADAFPGRDPASQSATVAILADTVAPSVTIVEPEAGRVFDEATGAVIPLRVRSVDAEVAVVRVTAGLEGETPVELVKESSEVWIGQTPVPSVDESEVVSKLLTVTAFDHASNPGVASVSIGIRPLDDPNAPVVTWSCPALGAVLPAGYPVPLRVKALGNGVGNVANGVVKVELFVDGGTEAIPAPAVAGLADHYEGIYPIPADMSDGMEISVRAVATNVSGSTTGASMKFAVSDGVVITGDLTIDDTNAPAYENARVFVAAGTTTVIGRRNFASLFVLSGATITSATGQPFALSAEHVRIECGGAVDATALGFGSEVSVAGEVPAIRGSGGSHLGEGGLDDGASSYSLPGTTYGSVMRPREMGGGGGYAAGGSGGGAIEIRAARVELEGEIRANGKAGSSAGAGAGGSVWIVAGEIHGGGSIDAIGGSGAYSGGGGGAIAIEIQVSATGLWMERVSAAPGSCCGKSVRNGAAGTVLIKGPMSTFGDLTVDSGGIVSTHPTRLPALGAATVGAVEEGRIITPLKPFWASEWLEGHWVEVRSPDGEFRGQWQVESVINRGAVVDRRGVVAQDNTAYSGYLLYSDLTLDEHFGASNITYHHDGKLFPARFANGRWEFDNNSRFIPFTPHPSDRVFASFTKGNPAIASVTPLECAAEGCGAIEGIPIAQMVRGRILANAGADGLNNPAEFLALGLVLVDQPSSIVLRDEPAGSVSLLPGDTIQGVYRFDHVASPDGARIESADPIRIGVDGMVHLTGPTLPGATLRLDHPIEGVRVEIDGHVSVPSITAEEIFIQSGATVAPAAPAPGGPLTLIANESLTVLGAIDADGFGYGAEASQTGEEPAIRGSGGSHLGEGGLDDGASGYRAPGTTFGSVTRPQEPGGGGGYATGGAGGGAIQIRAGQLNLEGSIRANGKAGPSAGAGAGGSVWIVADEIHGGGSIDAIGGSGAYSGGGGGAIAVEYRVAATGSWAGRVSAAPGSCCGKSVRNGAGGTVLMKGPLSTFGDLTVDNRGIVSTHPTRLPALGTATVGTVEGGRTVTPVEPFWVPEWLESHWVEVRGPAGELRGQWQVESVTNRGAIVGRRGVVAQDSTSYSGYLLYSDLTLDEHFGASNITYHHDGKIFPARFANGRWEFDNNSKFIPFTPHPSDRVFASFVKGNPDIKSVTSLACGVGCGALEGIPIAQIVRGRVLPNTDSDGSSNPAEFLVMGLVLVDQPSSIALRDGPETPVALAPGDSIRGVYRFDNVTLRGARLESLDLLARGSLDADAGSVIVNNQESPRLDAGRISLITGTVGGVSMAGTAGSITDVDVPLVAIARNERTGTEFNSAVAADGSFIVAISGAAGDTITIRARDGHVFPLESRPIVVGTLSTATPDSTRLEQTTWGVDAAFRARTLARDGTTLAVASYDADGAGSSSRLVLFDLANPGAPARRATVAGAGRVLDLATADGFAFAAASRFWSADLTSTAPAPLYATDVCGDEHAVVVSGGYAFGAEGGCEANNYINVYDVSTPSAPRYVRKQAVTSYTPYAYTDLFALGTDWLVAISSFPIGTDLVMIDRRDPNDLEKGKELNVPNFDAFRGALIGDVLWVVSRTSSEVATFDLSDPGDPKLIARAYAGASPNGITIAGGFAIVASGGSGLFAFDAADPTLMTRAGTATVVGSAWDVVAFGGYLYVADDTGLSIVPINIGPVADTSRIQVESGQGTATVRGLPLAVTGGASPTVEVAGVAPAPVAADGSFVLALTAQPGQSLTLTVRNGDGRSTTFPLRIPFAASVDVLPATPAVAGNDAAYSARRIAADGGRAVATSGTRWGQLSLPRSDHALLFTLPNASATATVVDVPAGAGDLWDVEMRGSWAFVVGARLAALNLDASPVTSHLGDSDTTGCDEGTVVLVGDYAFTAEAGCGRAGRIYSWDISNPATSRRIGTADIATGSGVYYRAFIPIEPDLLIAISSERSVTIIDRSNPAALTRVTELTIPGFSAIDGVIAGSGLYLVGLDAGVAIVDISNPREPQYVLTLDTPGIARAVAVSGPDEIVVADGGGPGLTFIDVANRTSPVILGSQPLVGNATDVRVIGDEILVATDHHVQIVRRP